MIQYPGATRTSWIKPRGRWLHLSQPHDAAILQCRGRDGPVIAAPHDESMPICA